MTTGANEPASLPTGIPVGPPSVIRDTEVIIVGTGAAGMTVALRLAEAGKQITLVTKDQLGDGSTAWAQGGLAAVLDPADSRRSHQQDTMTAGAGICNEHAVADLTSAAPDAIRRLIDLGAVFDRDHEANPLLGLEGGHSKRRIVHAGGDATGAEISRALGATLVDRRRSGHLDVLKQTTAVDVILAGDGSVAGLTVLEDSGRRIDLRAPAVVLASGGIGQAWDMTTNPVTATGDGIGIALRAGATVQDAEFVQFHPTVLVVPKQYRRTEDRGVLISEAVRGEGATLVDSHTTPIMPGRHPDGDLAPRDVVAATMHQHLLGSGDGQLYLDATCLGARTWHERFGSIQALCQERGVDPAAEPIPVRPAEHYSCGGVRATTEGITTVPGLYAIGEVAATGVHGANRLASNSLTEAVICADRLGRLLCQRDGPVRAPIAGRDQWNQPVPRATSWTLAPRDRADLVTAVGRAAGVLRDGAGLAVLLKTLAEYPHQDGPATQAEVEATNIHGVATLVTASALARTESRGCHRRADHPHPDDTWQRHSLAHLDTTGQLIIDTSDEGTHR